MVGMARVPARWLAAAIVAVALAGCGTDAGDGDLVDDWTAMVAPEPKEPVVGCYDAPIRNTVDTNTVATPVIACERAHTVETFHVGRFPDAGTAAPTEGTPPYRAAFDECERLASTFLGGQWYDIRVDLVINVPSGSQWDGGGRWYRCDLMETWPSSDVINRRAGTLREAARPEAPLAQRCVSAERLTITGWEFVRPIGCEQPHDAEYAGAFKVDGTGYPQDPRGAGLYERCRDVVAGYTGGTRDGVRLGYLATLASPRGWSRGDRYARCYAWRDGGKLTGTVKGLGNGTPR
jgi:hypothetical protein